MPLETLRCEIENRIAVVYLNRPDRMNAFTEQMGREIISLMDELDRNDDVRVIIFTGEGRAFCAGADLGKGADTFNYKEAEGKSSEKTWQEVRDLGGMVTLRLFNSLKPLIAAINGPAVGVGATLTLPMDIRLAADSAKMGFVFARRGIVIDGGASWFLPKIVGLPQSLEWVLSGRVFPIADGLKAGLVRSLHSVDDLLPAAKVLAREIADNTSAVSVAYCRQLLWRTSSLPDPMPAHMQESLGIYYTGKSADAKEGVMSFLEKREPQYSLSVNSDMPPNFPWWNDESAR